MGQPLKLESFDIGLAAGAASRLVPEALLEEERLQSFDKGYRAGWDDAACAHAEEQRQVSAELASNLQDLSFTYHEARSAVLGEMEGILRGVLDKVLPATVRHSLGEMIVCQINDVATGASEVPVEIVVSPSNGELVEELIAGKVAPPLRVLEEQTLGDGQAYIRIGRSEHKFDLEAVLEEISGAVSQFFEGAGFQEDRAHA